MRFEQLKERIIRTLSGPPPEPETVIHACHALSQELLSGKHDTLMEKLFPKADEERELHRKVREAAWILSREYLEAKVKLELGEAEPGKVQEPEKTLESEETQESEKEENHRQDDIAPAIRRLPLGVLFHIGAGNMDALPAFSVIEGLLAGNINMLKLPEADCGLSKAVLRRLTEIAPELKPFIYVFDFPSAETGKLKRLASLADAIVIWGGDEAVRAVRNLAEPSCRIIEWGHKISFAYVTMQGIRQESLAYLADHMLDTQQILCSSCQGIYLDTEDEGTMEAFCHDFSRILESAAGKRPQKDMGYRARNTLRAYSSSLEAAVYQQKQVYSQGYTSVTRETYSGLESSLMFGNCWVKCLRREDILMVLREDKGYLQTVLLLCGKEEEEQLSSLLYRAGAVQIRHIESPEFYKYPLPHDGTYPLQRYSKYVTSL